MLVGVIAGTLVDTQMGVDFLRENKMKALGYPVSKTPKEQSRLQLLGQDILFERVIDLVGRAKSHGAQAIYVYCNSLSAAIDMKKVENKTSIPIITPFTAYEKLGRDYSSLLILAANGQACAKIEAALERVNENITMWSISALALVEEIEKNTSPEEVFENCDLKFILNWAESLKVDALLLGCTHFPYLMDILEREIKIPILDPGKIALSDLKDMEDSIQSFD